MLQSRRARITRRIAMSGQQLCAFSTKRLASILAWHWVYAKLAPAVLTSQRNIYARTNTGSSDITKPRGFDIAFYLGTKRGRFVNGANGIEKHRSFDIAASEQSQHRSRALTKNPREIQPRAYAARRSGMGAANFGICNELLHAILTSRTGCPVAPRAPGARWRRYVNIAWCALC